MELFSLLAKLTLDARNFDKALEAAQNEANNFSVPDPELGLDKDEYDSGISEAQGEHVDDQEPKLGLDKKEYDDNIEDAKEHGSLFGEVVGGIFENLKGVLVTSGIVAAVSSVVSSLKEGVALAGKHGDAIDKQSQKMNISAKAYQEWSYALGLSGASIDDLNRGLRTWQQAVGDEDATNKLAGAFEQLGIDANKAIEQLESGENLDSLLDSVMEGLADYNKSDRGAIAEALFGKSSTGLNALFNSTSKDIRDMKQEAEDLGLVMTDEEVKNAAAYMDATSRMEQSINALKEAMVKDLLPYLTEAANTVAKIVAFFNPRTGNEQSLSDKWAGDNEQFEEELVTIEGTAAAAETLADKLVKMGDTSKMTADQYAIWKGTAEELIKLVPSLGDIIDIESGQIKGNTDEIKENIKQWENLAKQKALQTLKEEKYQDIINKNKELIDKSVEANVKAGQTDKARVETLAKLNEILTANGQAALDENATLEDVFDAQNKLTQANPDNAQLQIQFANALGEWTKANRAAIEAQQEADKLAEELEKGKQEYDEWIKSAEELYGIAADEISNTTDRVYELKKALESLPHNQIITTGKFTTHAIGANYIPYDNYPALLHRGEKVLTATEARRESDGVNLAADFEDRVIAAIQAGMADATVNAIVTDRQVAKGTNRYNGTEIDSGRFRP